MNIKIGNLFKGDKVIWMVFFFLCAISIIEVFSASSTLTYRTQNYLGPISYHTAMIIIGIVVTIITHHVPCRYFKLLTLILLVFSILTLFWVLFFGESINGANRVISLMGFTFQPSEIAKGATVLYTAHILGATQRESGADRKAFMYILPVLLFMVFIIGIENLSTAALLFLVIVIMMFVGRVPTSQMLKLVGPCVLLIAFFLTLVMTLGSMEENSNSEKQMTESVVAVASEQQADKNSIKDGGLLHRMHTWRNRILKFFDNTEVPPEQYDIEENFQVGHANIAIASADITGKGPGNSTERDYLPQAFSDFIYAIIIEEMGLFGAAFVVFLYIVLLYRAAYIASRCENNFPAFLVMGLSLLLVIQATFNMMVAVGLAPVTGQPLPLISKGGTSTIINCAYIGAILSVSRTAKQKVKEIED